VGNIGREELAAAAPEGSASWRRDGHTRPGDPVHVGELALLADGAQ